jgi:hypothetical protein
MGANTDKFCRLCEVANRVIRGEEVDIDKYPELRRASSLDAWAAGQLAKCNCQVQNDQITVGSTTAGSPRDIRWGHRFPRRSTIIRRGRTRIRRKLF